MGEIILPSDIVPNTSQDVVLDKKELSKSFDALVSDKNPIFLSMLGYVFYRATANNKRTKVMEEAKSQIPKLLQYDDEDFEKIKDREQGLINLITEKEIDKYFRQYLKEIEKTDMRSIFDALQSAGYFVVRKAKKNGKGVVVPELSDKPLKLDEEKLMRFKLTEVGNQSAIERLVDITERGQEVDEKGSERTGELMSAIDSGKPILYEMIKNYFVVEEQVSGAKITLDTKKYVNEVFIKEGFGAFDSENFPFKSGIFGSKLEHFDKPNQQKDESKEQYEARMFFEGKKKKTFSEKDTRNNIPLLHLKLIGDKGAGKYEQGKDKFLVEGLTGSKSFDTLEEAYDEINEISTKPKLVEKYLEKIIMSQDKHPLKNIIYGYLSAERRELKLGTLEIEINKTKEGSSKDKDKWVESTKKQLNIDSIEDMKTNNKAVKKVADKLEQIISFFEDMDLDELRTRIENQYNPITPMLTFNQKQDLKELEDEEIKWRDKSKRDLEYQKKKKRNFDKNNNIREGAEPQFKPTVDDKDVIEQKKQLKELRQLQEEAKEYLLEDETDESDFQNILEMLKALQSISDSPNIDLQVIFDEYEIMTKGGYLSSEEEEKIEQVIGDPKSTLSLAIYKYAKDLMTTSKFSGFSAGKSRIPILYADVTYDMNTLIDTSPKNYKFKLKPTPKDKSKPTPMGVDIVRVQKDFLNIKRGYNSLKALVRGS